MNYIGEREPHYGLRKLSIGVASVLLGISIYGVVGHADNEVPVSDSKNNVSVSKNVGDDNLNANDQVVLTGGDASSIHNTVGSTRNQRSDTVNSQHIVEKNMLNTSGVQNENQYTSYNVKTISDNKVESSNTSNNVSPVSNVKVVYSTWGDGETFAPGKAFYADVNLDFDLDVSHGELNMPIDLGYMSQSTDTKGYMTITMPTNEHPVIYHNQQIGRLYYDSQWVDKAPDHLRFVMTKKPDVDGIIHLSLKEPGSLFINQDHSVNFRGISLSHNTLNFVGNDGKIQSSFSCVIKQPDDTFARYDQYSVESIKKSLDEMSVNNFNFANTSGNGTSNVIVAITYPGLNLDEVAQALHDNDLSKPLSVNDTNHLMAGRISLKYGGSVLPNITSGTYLARDIGVTGLSTTDVDSNGQYVDLWSGTAGVGYYDSDHAMITEDLASDNLTLQQLNAQIDREHNVIMMSKQSDGSLLYLVNLLPSFFVANPNSDNLTSTVNGYSQVNLDKNPDKAFDNSYKALKDIFHGRLMNLAIWQGISISDPTKNNRLLAETIDLNTGKVTGTSYSDFVSNSYAAKGQSTVKLHIVSSTNGTDLATVKSFTDWPNQGKHAQLDVPTIAGYQLANDPQSVLTKFHLNGKVVTANSVVDYPAENTIADYYIVMAPKDENMNVNIADDDEDGKVLDSGVISGKFGDKVVENSDIQSKVQKLLDSGLYTLESNDLDNGLTFKDGSQIAVVKLKHKLDSIQRHYRVIEDLPDGTKKVIIDMEATLYKDASVDYYAENGAYLRGDIHQKLLKPDSFKLIVRDGKADLIDNQALTYIDQVSGYRFIFKDATNKYLDAVMTNSFIEHGVPKVYFDLFNGNPAIKYNDLVNGAAAVLPLSSRDFHIVYTKNEYPVTIAYYDQTGKQVASSTKSYDYLTQLDLSATTPANYVLLSGQPGQLTVGTDINEVDLLVAPKIERSQENKVITRTINLHGGNVKIGPVIQKVVFVREKVLNLATGDTSYGNWQVRGDDQFSMYVPPIIDGYHINKVDAKIVSADDSDSTVDLNYEQNESEQWPMYIDVNGKSYDKLPDGYHVVKGQDSKKGSLLIVKDESVVAPVKVEYVTRTITVIMPNGRTRTIKQKARKGSKFLAAHLPRLKGYRVEISGNIDSVAASGDMIASVQFVKM